MQIARVVNPHRVFLLLPPLCHQVFIRWPVLMEGDGGVAVRTLQSAMSNAGFHCGEDEMRWWHMDTGTVNALKTYQVRASLGRVAHHGVCSLCARINQQLL